MTREEAIGKLAEAKAQEMLSGRIIDAHVDLGVDICGFLFGDMHALFTDVFYEKTEMLIRMEFQATGVRLSVPALADREYGPAVVPYADLTDDELFALHELVGMVK